MTKADRSVTEFAPAKINLTLHVTGQRADGYHLLDSVVVFADIGDDLAARAAKDLSLGIDGPAAQGLSDGNDNLVRRAARLLGPRRGADITLTKRLPAASGIGGGSADAAAALRALSRLWEVPLPDAATVSELGADVPVCLLSRTARMTGIGDLLYPVPRLPALDVLLVNPRIEMPTADVFRALRNKANPPMPDRFPEWSTLMEFAAWLRDQRNDLQTPAMELQPAIAEVLNVLDKTDCLHAGMSGSGATCFALFAPDGSAAVAANAVQGSHPGWWCAHGTIL